MITTAPDGSPSGIRNTSADLTSISIAWSPITCIQQNSIIQRYIVYYRKSLTEGTRNELLNISAITTMANIDNLDPRTKYEFEVQGVNDDGKNSPSDSLNVTTSAPTGRQ